MIRRTLLAPALMVAVSSAFAHAAEGTFDKALPCNNAPTVSVATGAGYIHINPGSDNQFHVIGHVHAPKSWFSSGDPDAAVKQVVANPPITQTGNTITIGRPGHSDLYNNISIDYDITTPRATLLRTRTGSGNIQVGAISGLVTTETGSGSIQLILAGSHDVHARTGSGQIHIEDVTGAIHASTGSGSIDAAGNLTSDWNLSTGSGSIHVRLPGNARFDLDASTGSGGIHTEQPLVVQGALNRHHVSGTVNGGGPTLHARTGSGGITINSISGAR